MMKPIRMQIEITELDGQPPLWDREFVNWLAAEYGAEPRWANITDAEIEARNSEIRTRWGKDVKQLYVRVYDRVGLRQKAFVSNCYHGEWSHCDQETRDLVTSSVTDCVRQAVSELLKEGFSETKI